MTATERRQRVRAILAGGACVHPASVFDPVSARLAAGVGVRDGDAGRLGRELHGAGRARSGAADADRVRRADPPHLPRRAAAAAGRCRPRLRQRAECDAHGAGVGGGRRRRADDRGHAVAAAVRRRRPGADLAGGGAGKAPRGPDGAGGTRRRSSSPAPAPRASPGVDEAIARARLTRRLGRTRCFSPGSRTKPRCAPSPRPRGYRSSWAAGRWDWTARGWRRTACGSRCRGTSPSPRRWRPSGRRCRPCATARRPSSLPVSRRRA